jgi:hypothetical protein
MTGAQRRHEPDSFKGSEMKAFGIGSVLLLCGVLGACANPLTKTVPRASIGDFADHVLEPLALRIADEKIAEAGAVLKADRTPKASIQTVATLLSDVPWIGKLLTFRNVSQKAQLEEELARLERQRIPLKRELLNLFVSGPRTRATRLRSASTGCSVATRPSIPLASPAFSTAPVLAHSRSCKF